MKKLLIILIVLIITVIGCKSDKNGEQEANGDAADKAIAVEIKDMEHEAFAHYFSANGSVEAVKEAFISPEIMGQVKEIIVIEGERVRKGQLLATLNSNIIEKGISEVKTGLQLARTIYKKRKGLWEKKIGSEIQYLEAKAQKESMENRLKTLEAQLEMTRIKSPINGIVDEIGKKVGELSTPGMLLLRVVNLDKIYVNADVSEVYLSKIKKGDTVEVDFPSFPDLSIKTKIYQIGNVVNPQNRAFNIKLLLDNVEEKLKPNILAIIKLRDFDSSSALVVPSIIIKKDIRGSYIYVVKREEKRFTAQKTYIKPGISEKSSTIINEGLKQGQQVITKGYNLVKNGAEVKISKK